MDDVEMAAQAGACHLELGLVPSARQSLESAVGLLAATAPHRVRDRIHYLSRLARCHIREREVEQGCRVATEALQLSQAVASARVAGKLAEFDEEVSGFTALAPVHGFREMFHQVMSVRVSFLKGRACGEHPGRQPA